MRLRADTPAMAAMHSMASASDAALNRMKPNQPITVEQR